MTSLIISFMADDKPGLVSLLSKTISDHEGNWLDSSLSRLGGKFTGILVVQVPENQLPKLREAIQALEPQGIHSLCDTSSTAEDNRSYTKVEIDLIGHDKPGIVRDISAVLAQHQVNVIKLSTDLVAGSMSGELLFKARGTVLVPETTSMAQLQDALEAIAADLLVDISFA